jgi:hypothetical protein
LLTDELRNEFTDKYFKRQELAFKIKFIQQKNENDPKILVLLEYIKLIEKDLGIKSEIS